MTYPFGHERGHELAEKALELEEVEHHPEEALEQMLKDRPSPVAPGVDLAPVKALDPDFDEMVFVGIAHESYYVLRDARTRQDPSIAADLTDATGAQALGSEIADDNAARRYHVLAGNDIRSTTITAAWVDGHVITLNVRMHITSMDYSLDDRAEVASGDEQWRDWDEDWTFTKNVDVDESAEDRVHAFLPDHKGHWDVNHRGWNVHAITRV